MRNFSRMRRASGHSVNVSCFYDSIDAEDDFNQKFEVVSRDTHGDAYALIEKRDGGKPDSSEVFEVIDYDKYGESFDDEFETSYKYVANNWWPKQIIPIISNVCSLDEVSGACLEPDEQPFASWGDFEVWMKDQDEYGDPDYDWLWNILPAKAMEAVYDEAKKNIVIVDYEYIFHEINIWRGEDFSDIGLSLKPGWTYYKSHGYSQGDACIVLCSTASDTSEIDHTLWDAPIYCRIEIDGQEIYADSEMKNRYFYDKDEIIGIVKRIMGDAYDDEMDAELQKKVAEYPQYS